MIQTNKRGIITPTALFGIFVLTAIIYSVVNVVAIEPYFNYSPNTYEDCSGLDLYETSNCLNELVTNNFNYVESPEEYREWDDIVQDGGDCYDYNIKYAEWGVALGYNSYSYRICPFGDDATCHRIAVINDETGYCVLDQITEPKCFVYGN